MAHARMFEPISTFKRTAYARLRDLGTRRDHAAQVAGVSYSTARRLDSADGRCGLCGQPKENPMSKRIPVKPIRSTRQQRDVGGSGTVPLEPDTRAVDGDHEAVIDAEIKAAMAGPRGQARQYR
jgi:hypothetical protein